MRVLVIGEGAKDHAILTWFSRSNLLSDLFIAPGNISTQRIATNLNDFDYLNKEEVYKACVKYDINFVFIGTEQPLFDDIIDYLNEKGISTFGATTNAMRIETDRHFAHEIATKYGINTSDKYFFDNIDSIDAYLDNNKGEQFVVKSSKYAPSRTMLNSNNKEAILEYSNLLLKTGGVVIEKYVKGLPLTASILIDNDGYLLLPITADYMYTNKVDGKPTGGMGAVCPLSLTKNIKKVITKTIIKPTFEALKKENLTYRGVLTFSIMLSGEDCILVDYHLRFSDPSTQAMIPLIKNDICQLLIKMNEDKIAEEKLVLRKRFTTALVVASENYPTDPVINVKVDKINPGLLSNEFNYRNLILTGAIKGDDINNLKTSGGRCFTIVGIGKTLNESTKHAYDVVDEFSFKGSWYRQDIDGTYFEDSE